MVTKYRALSTELPDADTKPNPARHHPTPGEQAAKSIRDLMQLEPNWNLDGPCVPLSHNGLEWLAGKFEQE